MAIIRRPPAQTRIQLKTDILRHWQESTLLLLPGEIAISYELKDGKRQNFKLKVGALDKNGKPMMWKDLPFVTVDKIDISAVDQKQLITLLHKSFPTVQDMRKYVKDSITEFEKGLSTDTVKPGKEVWNFNCGNASKNI